VFDTWSAADNLYATVSDYALFLVSVMKAEGLTPEIARARLHPDRTEPDMGCADDDDRTTCPRAAGVGLGWMVFEYGKETVVMHTGRDWGENAIAFFVPERKFGVVVLTNGSKGMSVIREVAAVLYDDPRFAHFVGSMAE
jgi:CubicO group peptidase (beta-lactamase class C family)